MRENYTKKNKKYLNTTDDVGRYISHHVASGMSVDTEKRVRIVKRGSGYIVESTDKKAAMS